jgi:hypothetical protein
MTMSLIEVGGIQGLMDKVPPEYFSVMKPIDDKDFPWYSLLIILIEI